MGQKYKFKLTFILFLALDALILGYLLISGHTVAILEPKGVIADSQKQLMITALLIMLGVVIPVFLIAIYILVKYRAGNLEAEHKPDLEKNNFVALIFWLISITTIFIIGLMIWKSSHDLDPYKKIDSVVKPITIQVVALNWKWLFIYPEQKIATVNYIEFPKNVPVHFELTADAPMNTFWIPQLGGQMYAMAGMKNELNLMATETGSFNGSATEINGKGYAGMRFKVISTEESDFENWVREVKASSEHLNIQTYNQLIQDSENNPAEYFSSVEPDLFDTIMMKFMMPEMTNKKPDPVMDQYMPMNK